MEHQFGTGIPHDGGQNPKHNKKVKLNNKAILILVVVVLAGVSAFLFVQNRNAAAKIKALSSPQNAAKAETDALTNKVGKLIELPSNETPTIATVVDASKLKSQAFFANAQNGDKVLMYTTAKKAILYRPSSNIIVEVAPIDLGKGTATATPEATPAPTATPRNR